MTAKIYDIKDHKYLEFSAVCNTCGLSWTAMLTKQAYQKYCKGEKHICPVCQHTDVVLAIS